MVEKELETVKVIVRCRPFSEKESKAGHTDIVAVLTDSAKIAVTLPKTNETKSFTFDSVFGYDCKQIDVYNTTARPIVDSVLNGYNGTIFA